MIKSQLWKCILVGVIVVAGALRAEEPERTLLRGPIKVGGFGSPEIRLSSFNDSTGVWVGGRGGVILNHRLVLGGAGYGLVNEVRTLGGRNDYDVVIGYGGVVVEYILAPQSLLHPRVGILVGAGAVNRGLAGIDWTDDEFFDGAERDIFFVVEPEVAMELNLARFARLQAILSYRFASDTGNHLANNADLRGLAFGMGIRFGAF